MKKIIIFQHGEFDKNFSYFNQIHKRYQKISQKRIDWEYINGHIDKNNKNFNQLTERFKKANIFICDSDNTNINGQVEDFNFNQNCQNNLLNFFEKIKKINPDLKIFIKKMCYYSDEEIASLSKHGQIINNWVDLKVVEKI